VNGLVDLYVQQFKTTLASQLQYRASIVIWLIGHVLEPLIYLVVWSVVSTSTGGSVGGFTQGDFAAYFILLMLVNHVTYTWIIYEYEYRVHHGSLSFALLRPVHPIHSDIADNVSSKVITLPGMLLTALGLALLFRPTFHFLPWALVAMVPAVMLAFLLRFLVEWTLALAAFWTTRVSAINQMYFVALLFLSGQIAPLSLLPHPLHVVANILPFYWVIGFPVELLLGRLTPTQVWTGLAAQAVWLALSLVLVRLVWRAGVRVYGAVGA
jgi:ABC-2 type transport system permease protein